MQDNVFQCVLDKQYRDAGIRNADLSLSYVDNTIVSPPMSEYIFILFSCNK
jgi:hypothetical protein